ncbi:hypothetical protein OG535_39905 [Kitasatospora sp. NBC_00085]|uniref:hypothetical protein n=1 Tax=Kitasatospora sp. NBC_00085 TaxID=2903566 RepID=UPI00325449DD
MGVDQVEVGPGPGQGRFGPGSVVAGGVDPRFVGDGEGGVAAGEVRAGGGGVAAGEVRVGGGAAGPDEAGDDPPALPLSAEAVFGGDADADWGEETAPDGAGVAGADGARPSRWPGAKASVAAAITNPTATADTTTERRDRPPCLRSWPSSAALRRGRRPAMTAGRARPRPARSGPADL